MFPDNDDYRERYPMDIVKIHSPLSSNVPFDAVGNTYHDFYHDQRVNIPPAMIETIVDTYDCSIYDNNLFITGKWLALRVTPNADGSYDAIELLGETEYDPLPKSFPYEITYHWRDGMTELWLHPSWK